MNRLVIALSGFLLAQPLFADGNNLKSISEFDQYEDYFGYFLDALAFAKQLHSAFDIPQISELSFGYYTLLAARDLVRAADDEVDPDIVKTMPELINDLGLQAIMVSGNLVSFAWPNTYLAHMLTGAGYAAAYLPKVYNFVKPPLPELRPSYDLDEFTLQDKRQTTYLACSYTDSSDSMNNFKIWAEKELLDENLENNEFLNFEDGTVSINGRWILTDKIRGRQHYAFGTIDDPLRLQSACIQAVASYAQQEEIELSSQGRITISSGNNRFGNSFPVRFYHPVLMKHPQWSEIKPIIMRKAILLGSEDAQSEN